MLQAEFDRVSGRLSFIDPNIIGTLIQSALAWVSYCLPDGALRNTPLAGLGASIQEQVLSDKHGDGGQWVCHCQANPDGIKLAYHIKSYPQRPFLLLRLEVFNHGRLPVTLQNMCLLQASPSNRGSVQIGGRVENYRFLKVGWHGWSDSGLRFPADRDSRHWADRLTTLSYFNPATARPKGLGEFSSEGWGILAGDNSLILAGFATMAHQFGQVYTNLRPGHVALMLLTQLDGVRLDPGETCLSEWGYLQFAALPNSQPETDFVDAVAREMDARVPTTAPPMTWTHWYQFYHSINEQVFINNLDTLAGLKDRIPFQMAELDDGYQTAWGDWTSTNEKFPHGLEWLAKEVHGRGFTPGLWIAPFAVETKSKVAQDHYDWLVSDKKGKPARVGFQYNMTTCALDLTHPEVLDHLRNLAHSLTHDLGFGVLKLDFINAAATPGIRHDPKLTRAEALRNGLEAIRQGVGEETFLLGCGCPFGLAIGIVDAMRIGPDTAPNWRPYFHWIPWAGPLIKNNPSIPALRNAIRNTLIMSSLHQKWWWNDPDCLLVREGNSRLSESEIRSAVSLVGLSGGMLVSSDDLGNVPTERLQWLSKLIPYLGLRGEPLDMLEHEMPGVYRVRVEHFGQAWQLVALFNWSDQVADCAVRFTDLGFLPGADLHLFDFWEQTYQRVAQPEIKFSQVPAHGCKLLRICQVSDNPYLVGDTIHISQGKEVSKLRIVKNLVEIETIEMGRRFEGELWLALHEMPKEVTCNGKRVHVVEKGNGIYTILVGQ